MTYYPSLRQEKMRVASLVRNSLLLSGIIQVIDDLLPRFTMIGNLHRVFSKGWHTAGDGSATEHLSARISAGTSAAASALTAI